MTKSLQELLNECHAAAYDGLSNEAWEKYAAAHKQLEMAINHLPQAPRSHQG